MSSGVMGMSSVSSYYTSKAKASDRVGRIRHDMDRSSAYILTNNKDIKSTMSTNVPIGSSRASLSSTTNVSFRRPARDSSVDSSFRMARR